MTTDDKIVEYGKTMDLFNPMTVDMLIQSHKNLRNEFMKTNEERKATIAKAVEVASSNAREYALTHDFISRETLRKMTVSELVELLHEEDD